MRLLGSSIFLLVGVVIGILVSKGFKRSTLGYVPNIALGILGSFMGLWFRDVLDIHIGGNLSGSLLFSAIGAITILLPVNIFLFQED